MDNIKPRIKLTVAAQQFNIVKLNGFETIAKPYRFVIDLIDVADNILAAPAVLQLYERNIAGIITQTYGTRVIFEPRLALTKLFKGARVILNRSVSDVIKMILLNCGYNEAQIKFELHETHKPKPYRMQLPDETDFNFLQRIISAAKIFYWFDYKTHSEIIHFSDKQHAGAIDNIEINKIGSAANKVIIKSESSKPQPGYSIKLDDNYLIKYIQHYAKQNVANYGQESGYYNIIQLGTAIDEINSVSTYGDNYHAHIASNNKYAQLDEHGQYRWQQRFDLTEYPNSSALTPTKMLAAYSGWHLPLQHGAEVLVNTLNGDPDQPIILGTIPNADKTSPTTAINKMQHILRTQGDNQLLMDDTKDKQNIKLHTYGKHNLLELNAAKDNPAVNLITDKGDMTWQAKQDIHIQTEGNTIENIAARAYTAGNQQIQAKNIHYQAETDHNFNTETKLDLHSEQNMEQQHQNFSCHSNDTAIKTDNMLIHGNENISLKAVQNINLSSSTIEFGNNTGGLKITSVGTIEIFGNGLNLAGGIVPEGKVNHIPSIATTTNMTNPPQPLAVQTIPNLDYKKDKQDKKNPLQEKFNDEYSIKFNSYLPIFNGKHWFAYDQAAHKKQVQYTNHEIKFSKDIASNDKLELRYVE